MQPNNQTDFKSRMQPNNETDFKSRVQPNNEADFKSRMMPSLQSRVIGLHYKLYSNKSERLQYLSKKCSNESKRLLDLIINFRTLIKRITDLCNRLLETRVSPTQRSKAVIAAILENMFAHKKEIDDVLLIVQTAMKYADKEFNKIINIVSESYRDFLSPGIMSEADNLLREMHNQVLIIDNMASIFQEKCFQFLCIFQETLRKIKIVLKRK